MTVDPGILYRAARERVMALVSAPDLDPDRRVPATPLWTVRDVVAHLAGVARDATTGNMAGAPGDEWTARQVERSAGRTVADLLADWAHDGPILDEVFASGSGGMLAAGVFDVHTHEADLRNALGLPVAIPAEFLAWVGPLMREAFHQRVASMGLAPVTLELTDVEWFRGRLGRRTEAEVRAYPWPVDPTPYLPAFFVFGIAATSLNEAA